MDAGARKGQSTTAFKPVMIAPFGQASLGVNAGTLGNAPVITYVNDYGGRPALTFRCAGNECQVDPSKSKT